MPLCTSDQLACIKKVNPDYSKCAKSCNGILVTSYERDEFAESLDSLIPQLVEQYDKYKIKIDFPREIEGTFISFIIIKLEKNQRYSTINCIITRVSMEK